MKDIKVKWIGQYPALCHGEWIIEIDGKSTKDFLDKLDKKIEELTTEEENLYNLLTNSMGIYGQYSKWFFDKNYIEQRVSYTDGLEFNEWFESDYKKGLEKVFNLMGIEKLTKEEWKDLYKKIQVQDFRIGSCGGCI